MLSIPARFALRWMCLTGYCWFIGTDIFQGTNLSFEIGLALYALAYFLEIGIEPKLPERSKNFSVWPLIGIGVVALLALASGRWKLVSSEIHEVVLFPLAVVFMYSLILTSEYWRYQEYRKTLLSYPDATSVDA